MRTTVLLDTALRSMSSAKMRDENGHMAYEAASVSNATPSLSILIAASNETPHPFSWLFAGHLSIRSSQTARGRQFDCLLGTLSCPLAKSRRERATLDP